MCARVKEESCVVEACGARIGCARSGMRAMDSREVDRRARSGATRRRQSSSSSSVVGRRSSVVGRSFVVARVLCAYVMIRVCVLVCELRTDRFRRRSRDAKH